MQVRTLLSKCPTLLVDQIVLALFDRWCVVEHDSVGCWEVSVGAVRVDTHLFTSYLISNALEVFDLITFDFVQNGATELGGDGVVSHHRRQ